MYPEVFAFQFFDHLLFLLVQISERLFPGLNFIENYLYIVKWITYFLRSYDETVEIPNDLICSKFVLWVDEPSHAFLLSRRCGRFGFFPEFSVVNQIVDPQLRW